jgi:hypothetical protein
MVRQMQRVVCWSVLTLLLAGVGAPALAQMQPVPFHQEAKSAVLMPSVPLAECPEGVVLFTLREQRNNKGQIEGKLILDFNRRVFNEFGEIVGTGNRPVRQFDYTLKFLKKKNAQIPGAPPGATEEAHVYEVRGNMLATRLLLVRRPGNNGQATLLVLDKNGGIAYAVGLNAPLPELPRVPPCHPGCFPAGTPVLTPQGPRPIQVLREGDAVTTIRSDGTPAPGRVQKVFVTRNQLVKVETEAGTLLTTRTQPLVLADGKLRPAGELKAGDRIYQWRQGQRRAVKVLAVTLTGRQDQVFNVVLGDSEVFVAGGFLARSKPPAGTAVSALPAVAPRQPAPASRDQGSSVP